MANEQKITEIISESAFQQLDKLYSDLQKAADQYGKFSSQILELNKEISNSKSMADLEKALEKQILAEERIAKAKKMTAIAEEKLQQAKMRTLELAERAAKREADAEAKKQAAAKSAAEAAKKMAASEKSASDSAYNASLKTVVSEKEKKKALEASEAAARSAAAANQKAAEKAAELAQKQAISFKGALRLTADADDSLSDYGVEVDSLIQRQLRLRSTLNLLRSEFKDLGLDATPQQIKDFTLAQEQYKLAISQNAQEVKRLIREQSSAEGSLQRMEARLDSLRATYKKLTPEQRETEDSAKALAEEIARLDKAVKEGNDQLGVHNRHVGDYGRALNGLDDHLSTINPALGGFVDQLKQAHAAAKAFIASPIGAAIAAVAAALGAAKMWYDYNKGLQEATRLTKQLTNLSGDDLKMMRDQVSAVADVYEKDFNEVLIAANATAKNFGISYQEAIDIIKDGFIAGADASDDFLEQLKEYPTQLEAVGLSAEQTVALISQNVKEGIFSDKGIDAIKEGGIRLREMTNATSQALDGIGLSSKKIQDDLNSGQTTVFNVIQQVSEKLSEMPSQSAAVGTAIADIFGGAGEDAGLRYLTTLKDIDLSLSNLIDQGDELVQAQQKQLEVTEALKMEFSALFDQTGGGFELLIANAKLFVTDWLIKMIRGVADLYNWFTELYNGSMAVRGGVAAIGATFKIMFSNLSIAFKQIFLIISSLGKAVKAILTGNFSDLGSIIKEGISNSVNNFKQYGSDVASAVADGYNQTLDSRLKTISLASSSGGALDVALGNNYGGSTSGNDSNNNASKKAEEEAIKSKKELEGRLLELAIERLKAEENAIQRAADKSKEIATDEANGYEDRLLNLQYYLKKSEDLIDAQQKTQLKENAKYLDEASALEKAGRIEEANTLREIVLIKNKEIDQAVLDQKIQLAKEGNEILSNIYKEDAENQINQVYDALEANADAQLVALAERYAAGKLSDQQYADQREEISNKLTLDLINNEIKIAETAIALAKSKGIDVTDQEKELAALKIRLSKEVSEQQISDLERVAEREKQMNELKKELAQELSKLTFTLLDASLERQISDIEKQQELNNSKYEQDKANIENSVLSEEEKTARLFALDQKKAAQDEQLEKKKADLRLRQAKMERASNILGIIGSTALGIMKAFADLGPIAGIPFAAMIGATGAVQIATTLAQPLPKYYKGVKSSPEGFAHVGERGAELMIQPDGQMMLTPDSDTITYLKKGTQILTHDQTKKALAKGSLSGLVNGQNSNQSINFDKLLIEQRKQNKEIKKAISGSKYYGTVITSRGFKNESLKADKMRNWINNNGL